MPLLSLPYDILEKLLCCLNARDVLVCGRVCKSIHDVVTTSLPVRYKIALAARGMRDGRDRSASLVEKIEKLERYELAWRELAWKESLRLELPVPCRHVYKADGYFLIVNPAAQSVSVIRLPSPLRGVSYQEYNWDAPLGFFRGEGTVLMDLGNDLVTFLKPAVNSLDIVVDARSLSTGEIHPFAGDSTKFSISRSLGAQQLRRDSDKWTTLRGRYIICGGDMPHVLADGVRIDCPKIHNWTTGHDVTPLLIDQVLYALTFLDDTHALCLVAIDQSIELWIADLEYLDMEGRAVVTHIFQFSFAAGWKCYVRRVGSGADVGLPPPETQGRLGSPCYFEDDGWAAFNAVLLLQDENDSFHRLVAHIPFSVLRSFSGQTPEHPPTIIPYTSWSDANTLVEHSRSRFCFGSQGHLVCTVLGSQSFWHDYMNDNAVGQVVDIHPRRLAWLQDSRSRERTFNIPTRASNPDHYLSHLESGDCIVVQEHDGEDEADDEDGLVYAITVYSPA
ncbi:hypothetical protein PENSPDRAFT_754692 [Peniophora sp. CONT]|nr:hypothetical protein PENSPDRAFT_754692 [Peniophora sp. CONT]